MTAKCNLLTLPHVTITMPGKKAGERKKRRQCVKTLQGIPRKQSRSSRVVGDDSLTGPVVAGRLDETTWQAQQMIALA